jgi:hypothetical protein
VAGHEAENAERRRANRDEMPALISSAAISPHADWGTFFDGCFAVRNLQGLPRYAIRLQNSETAVTLLNERPRLTVSPRDPREVLPTTPLNDVNDFAGCDRAPSSKRQSAQSGDINGRVSLRHSLIVHDRAEDTQPKHHLEGKGGQDRGYLPDQSGNWCTHIGR